MFYEKGISIAGIPVKKINTKGIDDIIVTATQIVKESH
jgi:serine O-acetyltransferase